MSFARSRSAVAHGFDLVYHWTIKPLVAVISVVPGVAGQNCRYYPTCSKYAVEAVRSLGVLRGTWLAVRRVGRCHPWSPGGVDLVPNKETYRWWGVADGADGEREDSTSELTSSETEGAAASGVAATPLVTTKDSALRGA